MPIAPATDLPLILVIEDDPVHQNLIRLTLEKLCSFVFVETVDGATKLLDTMLLDKSKHKNVLAILFDGGLYSGGGHNTGELVRIAIEFHGFKGPTIAYSATHNKALRAAGCKYSVNKGGVRNLACLMEFLIATR